VLITDLSQLFLVLLLLLGGLEVEILLLGLYDHCELRFLGLGLLNQTLKLSDLFEILDLLICDLLVQLVLLLLLTQLVHHFGLTRARCRLVRPNCLVDRHLLCSTASHQRKTRLK